ncbi:four helix bundle protein [bacterium]|nr:MAG: four helix bundle protein [bacterium]
MHFVAEERPSYGQEASHYRKLRVWQEAVDLAEETYRLTSAFPKSETYGLTAQMRRSAVSVASNIAEGSGRQSPRDFGRFIAIAVGSLRELETQAILADRLRLSEVTAEYFDDCIRLARMLTRFHQHLERLSAA